MVWSWTGEWLVVFYNNYVAAASASFPVHDARLHIKDCCLTAAVVSMSYTFAAFGS